MNASTGHKDCWATGEQFDRSAFAGTTMHSCRDEESLCRLPWVCHRVRVLLRAEPAGNFTKKVPDK